MTNIESQTTAEMVAKFKCKIAAGLDRRVLTRNDPLRNSYNDTCTRNSRFVNLTGRDLFVAFRDGTYIRLYPYVGTMDVNTESLTIVTETIANRGKLGIANGENDKFLNEVGRTIASENDSTLCTSIHVPLQTVVAAGGGVYIPECDIYVTTNEDIVSEIGHPGWLQKHFNLALPGMGEGEGIKGMSFKIIDNISPGVKHHTIMQGLVVTTAAVANANLPDGLMVSGVGDEYDTAVKHYTPEEMAKGETPFEFFNTLEEANSILLERCSTNKALQLKHDKEMGEMEVELALLKKDNALNAAKVDGRKAEMDTRKAVRDDSFHANKNERDLQILRQQEELAILKMENERIKSNNDTQSSNQKGMVESIKTAGLVIAGGLSIMALLK